jgi:hypothetical protein
VRTGCATLAASLLACHGSPRAAETRTDAAPVEAKVEAQAPSAKVARRAPPLPAPRAPDEDASVADESPLRVVPPALRHSLCGKRAPCSILLVRGAGVDRKDRPMFVATVDLGRAPAEPDDGPGPADGASDAAVDAGDDGGDTDDLPLTSTENEDVTSGPASFGAPCHRYEHWLAVRAGAQWTAQLLVASCNDGYGASGVGEDRITVEDGGVTVGHSGGSNWRWAETSGVGLDPLRVRSEEWTGSFVFGDHVEHGTWSWELFRGRVEWSTPRCTASGDPPPDDPTADDASGARYTYDSIPQVALDPAFAAGGWKTTALGGCAAYVDSSGDHGFVTFGPPGAADDASMRVVASADGTLYVEVRDDRWVGPTGNWVADDHVEIWTSSEDESYMDPCLPHPDATPPVQWAVRIADGRVFAGSGHPDAAALHVERARGSAAARLHITLPDKAKAVTVVYSDGDDGAHQKRLIATSAVRFGVTETLGRLNAVKAGDATCAVRDGRLEPRLATPHRARDHAVVGAEEP